MDNNKIARVAERIRALPPEQFNMDFYCGREAEQNQDCGCIAYWTLREYQPGMLAHLNAEEDMDDLLMVPLTAMGELGLDEETAMELFLAWACPGERENITRQQAAEVMLGLARTGRVEWGPNPRAEKRAAAAENSETEAEETEALPF